MSSNAAVRLVLKFNFAQQIRVAGWSESYDLGYADLPTAIAALGNINAFITDRLNCLGAGPVLVYASLQAWTPPVAPNAPPVRRNSIAIPVPKFPAPGDAYNKAFNSTIPAWSDFAPTVFYISLQTNLSGSPVYRRNCWIAGLPDVADASTTNQIIDPATLIAINKFLKDLDGSGANLGALNNVSIRSIDRTNGNAIKNCTQWNAGPNTYTVPNHGFLAGQPILAEGMKTQAGGVCPRGKYLVDQVIDANTISLQDSAPPTPPIKKGGFRAVVYVFNQVKVATPEGFTKRDKGGPFLRSVGRRKTSLIKRA